MVLRSDDDLFSSSTMTFGEHLEELRVCLTKAVFGLLIGTIIGFFVAKHVVNFIETPVLAALKRYMVDAAKEELRYKYGTNVTDDMLQLLDDRVLVVEEVYLERDELQRLQRDDERPPAESLETATGDSPDDRPTAPEADPQPADNPPTVDSPIALGTEEGNPFDAQLPPPTMNFVKTRLWREAQAKIQALDPWETFMIYLKASLVVGAVISSPYVFYQLWLFVSAGLYRHERSYVYIYLPLSLLLFLGGVSLAFAFVFRPVLDFLFGYNRELGIAPEMRISSIISFVLLLPLGFGVSFQLPLVMFFLNRMGLVSFEVFVKQWRIAILAIFVAAMILTPSPDPTSMMLMALPLMGLYFLGLAMIKWMPGSRNPFGDVKAR